MNICKRKILSISIAAYNVENTLRECLNPFVTSGVMEHLDIMIVNDGSKDNTAELAMEYVKKYPESIRLINKENGGWGSTLNVGIRAAKGKYFKQLDGDDYYCSETLDDFLVYLDKADADIVCSPFFTFDSRTHAFGRQIGTHQFDCDRTYNLDDYPDFMPAMHTLCVKTEILKQNEITITEHCFYTDLEFVIKALNHCNTLQYFPWPVYCYRVAFEGQSMSVTGIKKHYKNHEKMLNGMVEYLDEEVVNPARYHAFLLRLMGACNYQYCFYMALDYTKEHKEELRKFDNWLFNNNKELYFSVNTRCINLLRKFNFNGYSVLGFLKNNEDKKRRRFVYEQ